MIERFRLWLRAWLNVDECICLINDLTGIVKTQESEIETLRAEVARLAVNQYVPPQTPEPERKIIQTRTMREFNAILEKEFEHEEA